jgi:L-rhamnose mutarotase
VTVRFRFTATLLPGREAEYDEIHRVTPGDLDLVIRAAGTYFWRIERENTGLVHFVEVEDIATFDAVLGASDVHARWQLLVGPLFEPGAPGRTIVDRFEFGEGELVWELPAAG